MPGVAAYGAPRPAAGPSRPREAGCGRCCCCRPTPTAPTSGPCVAHYREVAKAGRAGRRVQQPASTPRSTSTPALLARLHGEGLIVGGQGVHRRRPPRLRDRRTRPGPRPADRRRRRAAGAGPGRRGRLGRRLPQRAARRLRRALPRRRRRRPRHRAAALPALHPLLRWDSKTEFVQAIKLSMDIVGRHGGPCRPPRVPLTPEQEAAVRAATEKAVADGHANLRHGSGPHAHAATSSTPSTRTPRACPPG